MATSPLDAYVSTVHAWLLAGKSNQEIVDLFSEIFSLKTTEASIRRLVDRNESLKEAYEDRNLRASIEQEAEAPGVKHVDEETIDVILPQQTKWEDISQLTVEKVMERHQLDPEMWEAGEVLPNTWQGQRKGGEIINYYQFKLRFKKRVPISILLPATPEWTTFYTPKAPDPLAPVVTVIETDPQNPFIIEELDYLATQFIAWLQPDRHVVGGDLMNLGYIGRHRDNPKWDDTVNHAKQTSFDYLHRRREAAPDMEMWLIPGNHDDRIRNEQLERNERMYGVTQAHYPDEPEGPRVYSLSHLLRLQDLEVNYREPDGTYEFEWVEITPLLAVRHGHKLNQSKTAPINTAMDLGHSVVLGHSHSQSAVAKTVWNKISNKWSVRWAIEAGCECEIEEGLGFNKAGAPDWQPGFVTVTSFPNGQFTFDFAHYTQDGQLFWRDQVWSA